MALAYTNSYQYHLHNLDELSGVPLKDKVGKAIAQMSSVIGLSGLGNLGNLGNVYTDGSLEQCTQNTVDAQYQCAQRNQQKISEYYCSLGSAQDCVDAGMPAPTGPYHPPDTPQTSTYCKCPDGTFGCLCPTPASSAYIPPVSSGLPVATTLIQKVNDAVELTPGSLNAVFSSDRGSSLTGLTLVVGDHYAFQITGAKPGLRVTVDATVNGTGSHTEVGTISNDGSYGWSDIVGGPAPGDWVQIYKLNGVQVAVLRFNVIAAAPTTINTQLPNTSITSQSPQAASQNAANTGAGASNPGSMSVNPSTTGGTTTVNASSNNAQTVVTNSGTPSNILGSGVFGSSIQSFENGLFSVTNPSQWDDVFKSGDIAAIAGLAVPLLAVLWIAKGFLPHHR